MPNLFKSNSSPTLRMLLLTMLCIGLMINDSRYHQIEMLRRSINTVMTPFLHVVDSPFHAIDAYKDWFKSYGELIDENQVLGQENFELLTRLQRLDIIDQENKRLHELLNSSQEINKRAIVAKLLKVALEPYSQQITLDKGLKHEVYVGQSVIGSNGIMGQVIHVSDFSSVALLITDGKHDIPVQLNRTGYRSIARGTGQSNEVELLYVPTNVDIEVGDLIISSGFGGRFPRNYPVASVSKIVTTPSEPFMQIKAIPTAAIDRVSEVLLIWPNKKALREPAPTGDIDDASEQNDANDGVSVPSQEVTHGN